jgi:hypothetical protein
MAAATTAIAIGLLGDLLFIPTQLALFAYYVGFADLRLFRLFNGTSYIGSALFVIGLVGMAVAVPLWTRRCHRNLASLGASTSRWSPAWAVGAWFIPFASLVICYDVVREIWLGSGPDDKSSPLVWLWPTYWGVAVVLGLGYAGGVILEGLLLPSDAPMWFHALVALLNLASFTTWVLSWGLLALIGWRIVRQQKLRFHQLSLAGRAAGAAASSV